jgi:putative (di)nucleoside polyphosphate hydrolase
MAKPGVGKGPEPPCARASPGKINAIQFNRSARTSKEQDVEKRDVAPMHPTYRPGVAIVLINRFGKVLVARRIDGESNGWQMPQGGINRGESPRDAMLRELREEIYTDTVEILAESQSWRSYDVPGAELAKDVSPADRWQRQRQKWFLALFTGRDADIKLATDNPEFDSWRWVSPEELITLAAPFKRQLYLEMLEEFSSPICDAMRLITASAVPGETAGKLTALRTRENVPLGYAELVQVDGGPLAITDGEVNFIEGFTHDGSIGAECGLQLMEYWGYCERHAWVSLAVEMSMLHGFCSRSASLYVDILQKAIAVLAAQDRSRQRAVAKQLKECGTCMICNVNPTRRGLLPAAALAKAKDPTRLRSFAETSTKYWHSDCCPRCIKRAGGHLCRRHVIEAIGEERAVDPKAEREYLMNLLDRLEIYAWSFSWGFRGIDGPEDRAALISAIGWCSGWSSLAAIVPLGHPSSASDRSIG